MTIAISPILTHLSHYCAVSDIRLAKFREFAASLSSCALLGRRGVEIWQSLKHLFRN
jgi:hypothetical protein